MLAFSRHAEIPDAYSEMLLSEYHFAHSSLLQAMAELDTLTRGPLPSRDGVVTARWGISRASLTRRTLWSRVLPHLLSHASKTVASDLRRLQEGDRDLLRSSSQHVFKWNIEAVLADWPGYCAASQAIRFKMKAAIGAEQRVIYPLLASPLRLGCAETLVRPVG